MATLRYNNIYKTVLASMEYVADKSKVIPQADLLKVQDYIKGDHAETLYTVAYNCSSNTTLAAQQFEDSRELYWSKKKGKKLPGQAISKKDVVASHCYISFRFDDWITSQEILQILDEFIRQNHLDDFWIIAAVHRNTRSPHVHFLVSAYAVDGSRKLSVNNTKLKAMKKNLNYITYQHGYSIIDDRKLAYGDAAYTAWIESVKAEGKVQVYSNLTAEEKKEARIRREEKQKNPKAEKSIIEQIEDISDYNKRKNENDWKDQQSDYYYDSSRIPAFKNQRKQYQIKLWDENGRRRGTLELLLLLVATLLFDMQQKQQIEYRQLPLKVNISWELQRMVDGIAASRELGITDEKQLKEHIAECGGNISAIRRHIYYVRKAWEKEKNADLKEELERYEALLRVHSKRYAKLMALKETLRDYSRSEYILEICREETEKETVRSMDYAMDVTEMEELCDEIGRKKDRYTDPER